MFPAGPVTLTQMTPSRDGVEIAYATYGAGDGPAVVLVHGWAGNRTYWAHQIDDLAERYQVIAVDLGGHGESGLGRDDWNLAAFGDDVVAVVEEVGAQKVALVGHSMGGDAVVHAARQLGDRVAGIVLIDVFRSLGNETASSPEEVEAFVAPFRDDFAAAVDQFVRKLFRRGPTADSSIASRPTWPPRPGRLRSARCAHAPNREPAILAALADIAAPIVAINPASRRPTSTRCASTASSRSCSRGSVIPDDRGPRAVQSGARRDAGVVRQLKIEFARMAVYRTTFAVEAPVERVWEVLTDFDRWAEWNPSVPSIEGEPRVDSTVALTLAMPGRLRRR